MVYDLVGYIEVAYSMSVTVESAAENGARVGIVAYDEQLFAVHVDVLDELIMLERILRIVVAVYQRRGHKQIYGLSYKKGIFLRAVALSPFYIGILLLYVVDVYSRFAARNGIEAVPVGRQLLGIVRDRIGILDIGADPKFEFKFLALDYGNLSGYKVAARVVELVVVVGAERRLFLQLKSAYRDRAFPVDYKRVNAVVVGLDANAVEQNLGSAHRIGAEREREANLYPRLYFVAADERISVLRGERALIDVVQPLSFESELIIIGLRGAADGAGKASDACGNHRPDYDFSDFIHKHYSLNRQPAASLRKRP